MATPGLQKPPPPQEEKAPQFLRQKSSRRAIQTSSFLGADLSSLARARLPAGFQQDPPASPKPELSLLPRVPWDRHTALGGPRSPGGRGPGAGQGEAGGFPPVGLPPAPEPRNTYLPLLTRTYRCRLASASAP